MSRSRRKPYYKDGNSIYHRLYRRWCRSSQNQDMRKVNLSRRLINDELMEDVENLHVREYSEICDDWNYNDIRWYMGDRENVEKFTRK